MQSKERRLIEGLSLILGTFETTRITNCVKIAHVNYIGRVGVAVRAAWIDVS